MDHQTIIKEAGKLLDQNKPFALATIVKASSGSPGRTGFKMIGHPDGTTEGTVGGGPLELRTIKLCMKAIEEQKPIFKEFDLGSDLNMSCGGHVKMYIEYYAPRRTAYLLGGGHMGQGIAPLLKGLGFKIVVVDNRPDFADPARHPAASEVIQSDYVEYANNFQPNPQDTVIIFTHGHEFDYDLFNICAIRNLDVTYIGLIGSKVKLREMREKIAAQNYDGDLLERIHAPIGLNIARRAVAEISMGIAAEILAVYNGVSDIIMMKNKHK